MRTWKDEVVGKLTGGLGGKVGKMKISYVRGMAQFKDARTLTVKTADGTVGEMAFEQAILATGSRILPESIEHFEEEVTESTGHAKKVREIIDAEDKSKPLSDESLAGELKKRGIDIARRTVVKYRQQLDIPPARRRKVYGA